MDIILEPWSIHKTICKENYWQVCRFYEFGLKLTIKFVFQLARLKSKKIHLYTLDNLSVILCKIEIQYYCKTNLMLTIIVS